MRAETPDLIWSLPEAIERVLDDRASGAFSKWKALVLGDVGRRAGSKPHNYHVGYTSTASPETKARVHAKMREHENNLAEWQDAKTTIASAREGWEVPFRQHIRSGKLVVRGCSDHLLSDEKYLNHARWCNVSIPDHIVVNESYVLQRVMGRTSRTKIFVELMPIAAAPFFGQHICERSLSDVICEFALRDPEVQALAKGSQHPVEWAGSQTDSVATGLGYSREHGVVRLQRSGRQCNFQPLDEEQHPFIIPLTDRLKRIIVLLSTGVVAADAIHDPSYERRRLPSSIWGSAIVDLQTFDVLSVQHSNVTDAFRSVAIIASTTEPPQSNVHTVEDSRKKGGRPPKWDWDPVIDELLTRANSVDGIEANSHGHLIELIQEIFFRLTEDYPSHSTVRDTLAKRFPGFRASCGKQ